MRVVELLALKIKRRGLMRERARLHQQARGIEWLLAENQRDAIACERRIANLTEIDRRQAFFKRYEVKK